MKGQIILVGYDKEANEKLLRIEGTYKGEGNDLVDVVTFPDLDVSMDRQLLLDAIEFVTTH